MIKGTTPTHAFKINLEAKDINQVEITYSQNDVQILQKETGNCVIEDGCITTTLTQEETLKFDHRKKVQFQLRILTKEGKVLSTKVMQVDAEKCLSGEVLQ